MFAASQPLLPESSCFLIASLIDLMTWVRAWRKSIPRVVERSLIFAKSIQIVDGDYGHQLLKSIRTLSFIYDESMQCNQVQYNIGSSYQEIMHLWGGKQDNQTYEDDMKVVICLTAVLRPFSQFQSTILKNITVTFVDKKNHIIH